MTGRLFDEILLLLAVAVLAVTVFQRYRLPSSLAYLLVGIVIGPGALNWITDTEDIRLLSEFGIVFLLFTIGLSFPLPDIMAMRHLVAGVGTGQVALTVALIAMLAWLAGVEPAAAFVIGAAFAQSSTTVISKQLAEQGEDQTRHGRLGTAISIFQDITTVPFVVAIPVLALGVANGAGNGITGPLAAALIKATLAFAIMFVFGRKVLRPLFHAVAARRSSELFTLAVLLVSLAAAWITAYMGLSLALGAFFAGVMLAETEFRHQVETTIRPFRDVLLGLFFVSIGMLLDVRGLIDLWHWALALALLLLGVKALLVVGLARVAGVPLEQAVRTGLLLAVGGEFGFALAAIGLNANVLTPTQAQVTLAAILISIILAPLLIHYNGTIAGRLRRTREEAAEAIDTVRLQASPLRDHVVICGYGRIGQNVARFLEQEGIDYLALDLDPVRVREAHAAGEPVYYGDSSQREMLESAGIERARLLVISYDDIGAALKVLHHTRSLRPNLPVLVRTRDDADLDRLQKAGATEVVAETLEAGTMLVSHVLLLLDVPASRIVRRMRDLYRDRYRLLREFYHGEDPLFDESEERFRERLRTVALTQEDHAAGCTLAELALDHMGVLVTAIRRQGIRGLAPTPDTRLQAGDVLVLYGKPEDLDRAKARLRKGEAR